jgi:predicted dehydrogenase
VDSEIGIAGGTHGTIEASRVSVGPRVENRVEVQGTKGALSWVLERMNELQFSQLSDDGCDDGYKTVYAGPEHPEFAHFQPSAGIPMGYDDLRTIEAHRFLDAIAAGEQREPGVSEMVRVARVLEAIERSHQTGQWETVS